ncbi:MAG: archease [Thermodesulfobacteriota bacterium]
MEKFRYIDHTGDLGVEVFGDSLSRLFQNAGEAFADIMTDLRAVRRHESKAVSLEADRIEDLLVHWLNEFIFFFETEGLLFSGFEIDSIDDTHIEARIHGEPYDENRHTIKTTAKSATYHHLEVVRQEDVWKATVIFDL